MIPHKYLGTWWPLSSSSSPHQSSPFPSSPHHAHPYPSSSWWLVIILLHSTQRWLAVLCAEVVISGVVYIDESVFFHRRGFWKLDTTFMVSLCSGFFSVLVNLYIYWMSFSKNHTGWFTNYVSHIWWVSTPSLPFVSNWHLCLNITEKGHMIVADWYNRILDYTRKYRKNNDFQWK